MVLKKTPVLEQSYNYMLQGYICLWFHGYFGCQNTNIKPHLHHPQLSLKEIFIHSSHWYSFPFLSLLVHPESFAINYIKFNFSSPTNPHFSFFFNQDFRLATTNLFFHLLCPLIFTCFLITLLVDLVQCQLFSWSSCLTAPVGATKASMLFDQRFLSCATASNGCFPAFSPCFVSLFLNCPSPCSFWSSSRPSTFRSHLVYNMYSLLCGLPLLIFYLYIK